MIEELATLLGHDLRPGGITEQTLLADVRKLIRERDRAADQRDAAHALLRRLVEANGEQDYGIVAKARELLGMPESRLNPNPDSEHYHE